MEEHKHKFKNGYCSCGVESNNGRVRRLKRENRKTVVTERSGGLYEMLCAKDGKSVFGMIGKGESND